MTKSWLSIPKRSPFSLANIPFGVISHPGTTRRSIAVAIGQFALDLATFAEGNGFKELSVIEDHAHVFGEPTLNAFAALGQPVHRQVRRYLQSVFTDDTPYADQLRDNEKLRATALIPLEKVTTHLPFQIGDYTDFYAGKNHAYNCGVIFRGPSNALQPNYMHLPVGYHGRASSVVVSGTSIRRPNGQILVDPAAEHKKPVLSPSRKLDIELEIGAFICKGNDMGDPVPITTAEESVFGYVLLNDWSARDIQAWEYVPLGPFNGKNFGTSISPWVVLPDALERFRCRGLENDNSLLPYLEEHDKASVFDLKLEVDLTTPSGNTTTITRTNAKNLLFSFPQMIAHHTITGCPMQPGDLLGSGTISGMEAGEFGSMLEQSQNGKVRIKLDGSEERTFLEDGDRITLRGWAGEDEESLVGFGECTGIIQPAIAI